MSSKTGKSASIVMLFVLMSVLFTSSWGMFRKSGPIQPPLVAALVDIRSDEEMRTYCADLKTQGYASGAGTEGEPYIIHDVSYLMESSSWALFLENVNLHVTFRDCYFSSTARNNPLVWCQTCSNIDFVECTFRYGSMAIGISECHSIAIHDNAINDGSKIGIWLSGYSSFESYGIEVYENDIYTNNEGIIIRVNSHHNIIRNNDIHDCGGIGILLASEETPYSGGPWNNTIKDNRISNCATGISLNTTWAGIGHNNSLIHNNISSNDQYGIYLASGTRNTSIWWNEIRDNVAGEALDEGMYNNWDDGIDGNEWGDYLDRGYSSASADDKHFNTSYEVSLGSSIYDNYPLIQTSMINYVPVASQVTFDNLSPNTETDLQVHHHYFDQDGHPEQTPQIRWHKDGEYQSQFDNLTTIDHCWTNKTQIWNFSLRPYDGYDYGEWVASPQVTILNSGGEVTSLVIRPDFPKRMQPLRVASYTFSDPDGDEINGIEFRWNYYRYSQWYRYNFNISQMDDSDIEVNDKWYVELHVQDSEGAWGEWFASNEVTIVADTTQSPGDPTITPEATAYEYLTPLIDTATITWSVSDAETDLLNYWISDGGSTVPASSFSNEGGQEIELNLYTLGYAAGEYDFTLYANDSLEHWSYSQVHVTILDPPPPPRYEYTFNTNPGAPFIFVENRTYLGEENFFGSTLMFYLGTYYHQVYLDANTLYAYVFAMNLGFVSSFEYILQKADGTCTVFDKTGSWSSDAVLIEVSESGLYNLTIINSNADGQGGSFYGTGFYELPQLTWGSDLATNINLEEESLTLAYCTIDPALQYRQASSGPYSICCPFSALTPAQDSQFLFMNPDGQTSFTSTFQTMPFSGRCIIYERSSSTIFKVETSQNQGSGGNDNDGGQPGGNTDWILPSVTLGGVGIASVFFILKYKVKR